MKQFVSGSPKKKQRTRYEVGGHLFEKACVFFGGVLLDFVFLSEFVGHLPEENRHHFVSVLPKIFEVRFEVDPFARRKSIPIGNKAQAFSVDCKHFLESCGLLG